MLPFFFLKRYFGDSIKNSPRENTFRLSIGWSLTQNTWEHLTNIMTRTFQVMKVFYEAQRCRHLNCTVCFRLRTLANKSQWDFARGRGFIWDCSAGRQGFPCWNRQGSFTKFFLASRIIDNSFSHLDNPWSGQTFERRFSPTKWLLLIRQILSILQDSGDG